jgi:thiamine kinase-like enzyme
MDCSAHDLRKGDLETLLCQHLGLEVKMHSYKVQNLTQRGDNYSSTMLAVDAILQKNSETPHSLSLVAKLLPPTKFLCEVINIDVTFRKEVNAYTLVFPEFYLLQREKEVPETEILDVFPKLYGARINRHGDRNEKADETAVLLLENLKILGYETGDRRHGLNLKQMELGVTQLAGFHALSVALKILKPQVFKETALKACESFQIASKLDETGLPKWIASTMNYVKAIPECEEYLQKIENALILYVKKVEPPTEPFAAFIHNDLWVNNVLFQHDQGGNHIPSGIKFVDFQLTQFSSPAKDLIFFIYSSAMMDVINNYYGHLVHIYHCELTKCLRKLGCNADPFSFQKLQEEINKHASLEFAHILMMLKFICADENQLPELSNTCVEELLETNTGGDIYVKKVIHLVEDFLHKGWL